MSENKEEADKRVAYYSACVNSWFVTRMELDKSLLTLSAGGIGILVTVLSTAGLHSIENIILYIIALLSFLVCLFVVLWIFRENSEYLAKTNAGQEPDEVLLKRLDTVASSSFLIAVLFSAVIGISIAINSFRSQEEDMTTKKLGSVTQVHDSVQGMNRMQPTAGLLQNSFGGATSMRPQPAPAAPATSATAASGQTSGTTSTAQQASQSTER